MILSRLTNSKSLFNRFFFSPLDVNFLILLLRYVQCTIYRLICLTAQDVGLQVLKTEDRVTATEFRDAIQLLSSTKTSDMESITRPYLLIDVRPHLETTICRLPESVNVPFDSLEQRADELKELVSQHLPQKDTGQSLLPGWVIKLRIPIQNFTHVTKTTP